MAAKKKSKKAATAKKKTATAKRKTATAKKPKVTAKKKTSAKRSKKITPSVSPLRGVGIETWSKRLEGWHVDALRLIRAIVARHAPAATLGIKWGQPVWEHNGPFAWARPATSHLSFGFWRGSEIADPTGVLEGDGTKMRHVKITSAEHVKELPLEALIKDAVRLNETMGDPTKRG